MSGRTSKHQGAAREHKRLMPKFRSKIRVRQSSMSTSWPETKCSTKFNVHYPFRRSRTTTGEGFGFD